MRLLAVGILLATITATQRADAAWVLSISDEPLQRNARNQPLSVYLRSDSDSTNSVYGIELLASIGDGTATQVAPRFDGVPGTLQAVQFSDGAGGQPFVWENLNGGFGVTGAAPEAGNPYQSDPELLSDTSSETVNIGMSETLVAQFLIDTTGFAGETFAFNIGSGSGVYTLESGAEPESISFSGTFEVTAVPEPSSWAVLGLIAATGGGVRRMRQRKQLQLAD